MFRSNALGLLLALAVPALALSAEPERAGGEAADFSAFLQELWPAADAKGISRATFDAAFKGRVPDPRVIAATRKQPEYGKPFGAYVNAVASKARIEEGGRKIARWAQTFEAVEEKFAVDRWILCAIWGIESSFGEEKDRYDVVVSLATLAAAGYRDPYFRNELLVALKMMQAQIPRDRMVGSWAGAMGQPQFMPTDFIDYAVTFSGRGRPDIWTNVPDTLASMGNYLHKTGWRAGLPWGLEVLLPEGFDYARSRGTFAQWAALGVKRADGAAMPPAGEAIMFFPAGASGPAFLVTENFVVIKRYNDSDVYALAVGHLADRLHGMGRISATWPADDHQLSRDERIALQTKLKGLGYPVRDFQGHIDFDLRDAIREVQHKFGMVPDGNPTRALLENLDASKL